MTAPALLTRTRDRDPEFRKAFGARFRQAREAVGLTQKQVAAEMNCDHSRISQLENGQPVADHIFDAADQRLTWASAGHQTSFMSWLHAEQAAASLWNYQPGVVPGQLQTEPYARCVLEAATPGIGRARLDEQVAARLGRQDWDRDEPSPPAFSAVIGEAALRRLVGTPEVMHGQLEHLAVMSAHRCITLRVLAFRAAKSVGLLSPFVIARFAGGARQPVAFLDHALGGETVDDQASVETLMLHFDRVAGQSLSTEDSLSMIRKVAGEWT